MANNLLSICIPTYNRVEYLEKTIKSIVSQEEFKNGKVEIVISDNASTDATEDLCIKYSSNYKNFIYSRNPQNINNDNFPLVLSKGSGILRRLCNDNLIFEQGALKYICGIIEKYRYSRPYICWLENHDNPDIENYDFRNGLLKLSFMITAIKTFSIWENECNNIAEDTFGAQLMLWQVRKMLEVSSEKNSIIIVNKRLTHPLFVKNKDISYGVFNVFYENYFYFLKIYYENGLLNCDDMRYLEKDLLLRFFPYPCVNWRLRNQTFHYSESEDLENLVYKKYHDKEYWRQYKLIFYKMFFKEKIKRILKKRN